MSGPEQSVDSDCTFYLVQRLTRRDLAGRKGFDGIFGCDYMGAAEFEWGAIPDSLKRIRAAGRKVGVHVGQVTRNEITIPVFVVGHRKRIETVPDALTAWMVDRYPRGKEMSYFPEHVEGSTSDYQRRVNAWWSLTDDVMWALDADTADDLLRAVLVMTDEPEIHASGDLTCAITKGHCHLQGVRRNAQPCTAICDLRPATTPGQPT